MFVTRFAPSPTGLLHLGHAFSALTAFEACQKAGGAFILRVEDLDITRCRPEFEAAICEDLAWLGIKWETPVRRQSDHMAEYAGALNQLIAQGVMYRCFKTRKEILADIAHAPHNAVEVYRGLALDPDDEAKRLSAGQAFAWRLSLAKAAERLGAKWHSLSCIADGTRMLIDPALGGDVVLARKEFLASYHLASVYDDALQGITHVIRGQDLMDAAHVHVVLQTLLGLPIPTYQHHRLILADDGKRLAKRDQSVTLRALRQSGVTPDEVRTRLDMTP
jgi:glutamyl-Q tRNA(Asp) synthetase